MSRYVDADAQMMFQSAVTSKKVAYNEYKTLIIKWLQSTWIDDNGDFVFLKSDYKQQAEKAEKEFKRASIEVEHWRIEDGQIR